MGDRLSQALLSRVSARDSDSSSVCIIATNVQSHCFAVCFSYPLPQAAVVSMLFNLTGCCKVLGRTVAQSSLLELLSFLGLLLMMFVSCNASVICPPNSVPFAELLQEELMKSVD